MTHFFDQIRFLDHTSTYPLVEICNGDKPATTVNPDPRSTIEKLLAPDFTDVGGTNQGLEKKGPVQQSRFRTQHMRDSSGICSKSNGPIKLLNQFLR